MKIDLLEAKLLRKTLENALRIFEKDLSRPQLKAVKTVVRWMLCKTTTVLSAMHEWGIRKHKFIEKISKHLWNIDLVDEVESRARRAAKKTIIEKEKVLVSYDESDIFKPDAKMMPGLWYIRDGSTWLTGNGYMMRWININGISVVSTLDKTSLAWMEDDSKAEKILRIIVPAMEILNEENSIVIIDRWADITDIFDWLHENWISFLIRGKRNRVLCDESGNKKKITKFQEWTHKVSIEWWTNLMLHVIKRNWFRMPIFLYTNCVELDSKKAISTYLKRWEIEKDFKKMKQLWLEWVRLMNLQKIRNILALNQLIIVISQQIFTQVLERKTPTNSGLYLYYSKWCYWKCLSLNPSSFITYLSNRLMPYVSYNVSNTKNYWLFGSWHRLLKMGNI